MKKTPAEEIKNKYGPPKFEDQLKIINAAKREVAKEVLIDIINIAQNCEPYIDFTYREDTERYIQIKEFLKKLKEYREGLEE